MKKIFIVLLCCLTLAACSKQEKSKVNIKEINKDLELINFVVENNQKKSRNKNEETEDIGDDTPFEFVKDNPQNVIAVIKNTNRLSFIDIVLNFETQNKKVVFNEGNGTYTCSSTTVLENDLWVTKLTIPLSLEFDENFHSVISIESINFLSLASEKVEAYIDTNECKTLKLAWIGDGIYQSDGLIYHVVSDLAYVCSYTNDIRDNLVVPEKVTLKTAKTKEYYVAGIEEYAFKDCSQIKTVKFERPAIISKIGEGAFYNCSNLFSVEGLLGDMPFADYLFYNDTKLVCFTNTFSVPIGKYTFYNNYNFGNELVLLKGVTTVGEYAFAGCDSINTITIDKGCVTRKNSFSSESLKELSVPGSFFENESYFGSNLIDVKVTLLTSLSSLGIYENYIQNLVLLENVNLGDIPRRLETLTIYNPAQLSPNFSYNIVVVCGNLVLSDINNIDIDTLVIEGDVSVGSNTNGSSLRIKNLIIGSRVEIIPAYAFYNCDSLKGFKAKEGLKEIQEYAFYECDNLYGALIPESTTTFGRNFLSHSARIFALSSDYRYQWSEYYHYHGYIDFVLDSTLIYGVSADNELAVCGSMNNQISEIKIPASIDGKTVTLIENEAFYWDDNIRTVILPNTLKRINDSAFHLCSNLSKINFPESILYIGNRAFCQTKLTTMYIPSGATEINDAFSNTDITSVDIPNSITSIGYGAFQYTNLSSIDIPNSVLSIGGCAFGFTKILSVEIPNSVRSIGDSAFEFCQNLKSCYIPKTVSSMGRAVFTNNYEEACIYCESSSRQLGWDERWTAGFTGNVYYGSTRTDYINSL